MKIIVAGGAGFLGQHLVKKLAEKYENAKIVVLDLAINPYPYIDIKKYHNVEVVYNTDITSIEDVEKYFESVDICFNLVGFVSFWAKDKDKLYKINADVVKNLIDLCFKKNVKKFIHISSVASLGFSNDPKVLVNEKFSFDFDSNPNKHYMLSKRKGDLYVLQAYEKQNLQAIIACPALMWGAGDWINMSKLIVAIKKRKIRANMPGGTYIADVEDVAEGLLAILAKGRVGQKYILGGWNYTFEQINNTIAYALGLFPIKKTLSIKWHKPLYLFFRGFEKVYPKKTALTSDNLDSAFMFRYFDNSKANQELGWKVRKDFSTTVKEQIEYLQKNNLI